MIRRLAATALLTLTMTLGLTVASGVTSPASALSSCTLAQWQKFAQVKCTSGTGQVRAAIGCTKWWSGTYVWTRYGPWVGRNSTSQAKCGATETPRVTNGRVWHWYERR